VVAPAIQAVQQQPQHVFLPSLPYNVTLNISSILSYLPSSNFISRSKLFTSIRNKWWQDAVDLGVVATATVVGRRPSSTGDASPGALGAMVDMAAWPTESMLEAVVSEATLPSSDEGRSVASAAAAAATSGAGAYMGPWSFFTSGYMLGLCVVAVLLHRIQNIIIPSRVESRRNTRRRRQDRGLVVMVGRVWGALLPLDLSKTTTRLVIHLPSLYLLSKWLLVWVVLVLQTSHLYPVNSGFNWINHLGNWVEKREMSEVCWKTFIAVCAGFVVEGFVKALDGVEAGFPIGSNMNPNTSPFNIVGYAFLLHLYASPFAHVLRTSKEDPSRPDKNAIITITIPLLQLTLFHALSVSRKLSTHRLIPTALTSFLSLIHFHGTLFSHWKSMDEPPLVSPQARLITTYPILNYIPNVFETMLIITILLTVALNIIVQLIVRGRVDRLFSGLGVGPTSSSIYAFTLNNTHQDTSDEEAEQQQQFLAGEELEPTTAFGRVWAFLRTLPYDEDFGVLLLRVGTASLEATGLRGWSNEVAPIAAPVPRARRHQRRQVIEGQEYGSVRLGRLNAAGVQPGYRVLPQVTGTSSGSRSMTDSQGLVRRRRDREATPVPVRMQGLRNEVRNVDIGLGPSNARSRRGIWRKAAEMWRYMEAAWAAFKGLVSLTKAWLVLLIKGHGAGKRIRGPREARVRVPVNEGEEGEEEVEEEDEDAVDMSVAVYEKFLRGENISDDEEEDDEYRDEELEEEEEEEAEEREEDEEDREAFSLFTDILRNGVHGNPQDGGGGEVVLAHLIDKSPMTRRRWNSLSSSDRTFAHQRQRTPVPGRFGPFDSEEDDPFATSSSESSPALDAGREIAARSVCVICTTEARDVICWPCRCLAMCDGCREVMAGRSAPAKHRCPCCRRLIEGYSKIYVP